MKINYCSLKNISTIMLFLGMFVSQGLVAQTSFTFNSTGAVQTWTVPPCVNTISVDLRGAQGTSGSNGAGGLGGRVIGTYSVIPGQVVNIYVGTQAGYNGGGTGGGTYGMNGGGASDIRIGGTALSNRIFVAGGGGGAGYCNTGDGGYGGGTTGGTGYYCSTQSTYPGTGGTQSAGGSNSGGGGSSGSSGTGGNGYTTYGGGGGGGWYGGGGATYGGGGGGSSYAAAGTSLVTHTSAYNSGNGQIRLSFDYMGTITQGTVTPSLICTGSSATINTTGGDTYTWSASPATASTVISSSVVIVSPTVNTTFSVSGTNSIGCISSYSVLLQVDQAVPSLSIANTATNSAGICPGKTLALTASGARTYTWNPTIVNGGTFAPTSSNVYTVTGGNACGTSTAAVSVSIHPTPTVTASRSTASLCSTQSAVVTGGGAVTYTWAPANIQNGMPFYPFITNIYTVTGTSALGCTNSAQTSITVVTTPVIPPTSSPTLICIGNSATISASGASNYSWTSSSWTNSAATNSVVVSPTTTTTYSITKWNANCYKSDSITVIVNQLPTVFAVVNPTIVCAGSIATLQAGGGVTYSWAPGNLPSGAAAANIIVTPQNNTTYTVTASDGTCVNTSTVALATNTLPIINISFDKTSICFGETVNYNISGALNYTFSHQPATLSPPITGPSGALTLTTTSSYNVVGKNAANCIASAQQVIIVNPLPLITINRTPTLVCVGFPSTLTASSAPQAPAHGYVWKHGGNNNVSVVNPTSPTIYTVTGTNNITQCVKDQTVFVNVFQPTFNTTSDTSICLKGSINLLASGALSYTWSGGPSISTAPFYNVTPTVLTVYTVAATSQTVNNLKCISKKEITVDIYLNPTVTAVGDRSLVCRGETIQLFGGGANTYYWPTINQSGGTVVVAPTSQKKYTVIGTDIYGCKDTSDVTIFFSNCVGLAEQSGNTLKIGIYPNPNTGVFTVEAAQNLNLQVINGLGQVVREVTLSEGNNRHVDITDLSPGVYYITGQHENMLINEKILINR